MFCEVRRALGVGGMRGLLPKDPALRPPFRLGAATVFGLHDGLGGDAYLVPTTQMDWFSVRTRPSASWNCVYASVTLRRMRS